VNQKRRIASHIISNFHLSRVDKDNFVISRQRLVGIAAASLEQSSMSLSNELASSREQCLATVVETFDKIHKKQADDDTQSISISSICEFHDRLLSIVSEETEAIARTNDDILRLRLLTKQDGVVVNNYDEVKQRIPVEADLYRAVILTSLYLLEKLTSPGTPNMDATKAHLQITIRQANALLKVLSSIYGQYFYLEDSEATLPTTHTKLEPMLAERRKLVDHDDDDDDSDVIMSFDKEQLEMEEDELLQMASTPTPDENRQQQNEKSNPKESLLAELLRDHGASPIQVTLNDLGILRAHNSSSEREKTTTWWAITSTSSISYENPHFKITRVLTNRPKLCTTTLTLDVGKHGHLWWERSSRIVHQLKELQDLQDELKIIWSPDDFQVVLEEARRRICFESPCLN
jgi:hypothetical protein